MIKARDIAVLVSQYKKGVPDVFICPYSHLEECDRKDFSVWIPGFGPQASDECIFVVMTKFFVNLADHHKVRLKTLTNLADRMVEGFKEWRSKESSHAHS